MDAGRLLPGLGAPRPPRRERLRRAAAARPLARTGAATIAIGLGMLAAATPTAPGPTTSRPWSQAGFDETAVSLEAPHVDVIPHFTVPPAE